MTSDPNELLLGHCGHCETPLPADQLLITYRTDGGWPKMYAECPVCEDIVRPV